MKDILERIAESSPNESSHELICRLRDCAHEIEALRSALASRPDAQDDERGAQAAKPKHSPLPEARAAAPSPDREQVGEAILGSPAFALRGLYKLATEYFIDGKPATPDEYIAWQRGIIEALTNSKIPDPKYYGTQDEDGAQHEVKCAYVDGWNGCRASILAKDASPSRERGKRQVAALSDEQARTVECADSWLRVQGLQTYTDLRDTLFAVLRAIGYTEEFAEAHPDLKVSEGVKLFLAAHSAGAQEPVVGWISEQEWKILQKGGRAVIAPNTGKDADDTIPLYAQPQPLPQTDAARDQLRHFANAERFSRAVFADDSAFADWVISRSRHVLAEIERLDGAKGE